MDNMTPEAFFTLFGILTSIAVVQGLLERRKMNKKDRELQ